MADYYAILDLPRTATKDEIKKAYRKKALQYHPDKNPDNREEAEKKFLEISEAYEVLSNDNSKYNYDNFGHTGKAATSSGSAPDFSGFSASDPHGFTSFTGKHEFTFKNADDLFKDFFGNTSLDSLFQDDIFKPSFSSFGNQTTVKTSFPNGSTAFPVGGETSTFSSRSFGRPTGSGFPVAGNFVARSVTKKTINGVSTTITTEKDRNGTETVTTETSDGKKTVTVNGVLQIAQ